MTYYVFNIQIINLGAGEQLAAYNAMDTVVCVAQDTERAFRERFPMCTAQTKVIYNPIDIAKVERMGAEEIIKNDRFTIVMTGRLTPPKQKYNVLF